MSDRLLNALKGHMAAMDAQVAKPRFAVVQSVDPATMTAKVTIQPENVLTGWLPILSPIAGQGWGVVAPPSPGQQVVVAFQEGRDGAGVVLGAVYSTTHAVPAPSSVTVAAGEMAIVHPSGSFMHFSGNNVRVQTAQDLIVNTTGNATIHAAVNATVSAANAATVSAASIGLVSNVITAGAVGGTAQRLATEEFVLTVYNNHTHTGAFSGATSHPSPQSDAASLTTYSRMS